MIKPSEIENVKKFDLEMQKMYENYVDERLKTHDFSIEKSLVVSDIGILGLTLVDREAVLDKYAGFHPEPDGTSSPGWQVERRSGFAIFSPPRTR